MTVLEELGAADNDDAVWAPHTASLVEASIDDVKVTQQQ
jgi:hypothetical protein